MPNRILREGILTSPRLAKLAWPEEVFYRRLHSVVDDFGRYHADLTLLHAACYPRQLNKVSDSDIGKWLHACEVAGLVRVYASDDGERYLEVRDFGQQIRAKKSKFPDPPIACAADAKQVIADAHLDVSVSVSDISPPKGSRFEDFWSAWPKGDRKQDKGKCFDKWVKGNFDAIADVILADIEAKKQTQKWRDGYVEAPVVYLNNRRWEDGGGEAQAGKNPAFEGAI